MSFIITTDSNCDLSPSYIDTEQIHIFSIGTQINNEEIDPIKGQGENFKTFYDAIRSGEMPTTSQVNVYTFKEKFIEWIKNGNEVLYIAFSSGLSGTYASAMIAKDEVIEEYPNAKINIVDTLAASGGQGYLVTEACKARSKGMLMAEVASLLEEIKQHIVHVFIVDDLKHLERGGRVSAASAFVGTLLQIKPVLYVNDEGKLIPFQKMRGRKKAMSALVNHYEHLCIDKTKPIAITHGDCEEDAKVLAEILKKHCGTLEITINPISPGIGTHSGPATLALFFWGAEKTPKDH